MEASDGARESRTSLASEGSLSLWTGLTPVLSFVGGLGILTSSSTTALGPDAGDLFSSNLNWPAVGQRLCTCEREVRRKRVGRVGKLYAISQFHKPEGEPLAQIPHPIHITLVHFGRKDRRGGSCFRETKKQDGGRAP